jgi:methionyl-tRNA formyltransferase
VKTTIILICALEEGRIVHNYFSNLHKKGKVNLLKVYTYEDKVVPNKNMFVPLDNIVNHSILKKIKNINSYKNEISKINPDFIFVAGWSQLIGKEIINASKKGIIGFHTAKLPKDRGRSTIAWQIEEGYKETALTMFYIAEGIDNGDIIAQKIITITPCDYVNDIISKMNTAIYDLLEIYFPILVRGKAPRIKQDEEQATYRRLRNDDMDCLIDWDLDSMEIYNHIRAVSFPYPKAWTLYKGEKIRINKAILINFFPETLYFFEKPGTIIGNLKGFWNLIKTRNGIIAINDLDQENICLLIGEILGK